MKVTYPNNETANPVEESRYITDMHDEQDYYIYALMAISTTLFTSLIILL